MLDKLSQMHFSWSYVITALVAIGVTGALSQVAVGRQHQKRIRVIVGALAASLLLHFIHIGVRMAPYGGEMPWLNALAVMVLAFGLTVLVGLIVFDVGFGRARMTVPTILRDIVQALAFSIILLVVLRRSGVNLLSLLTTSAVLTAVIGLALQSTIANMFAGLSLQLDRTLNVGDWIQLSSWVGRITHIKWRSTFIVTRDGNNVMLPNSELLRQEVLNFSKPSSVHRSTVHIGIAYRHPPREVAQVLIGALRGMPELLASPPPDCLPVDFADSAITYAVRYWTDNVELDIVVQGEVRVRLWYAAARAGLEIPFPQRVVQALPPAAPSPADADSEKERQARRSALAGIDLFAPLDAGERERLVAGMKAQRYAAGELILQEGEVGGSLYIIQRGHVGVTVAVASGNATEVARLGPGKFFGEMSLLTGAPCTASCRAQTDVDCWVVDHETLRSLLANNPKIAEDMTRVLAKRQRELAGKRSDVAARSEEPPLDQPLLARIRAFFSLG